MDVKLIVSKEAVAKHGLEGKLFQLAKVIRAEQNSWVFIPANNLKEMTAALEARHISYGIEAAHELVRERLG